ncbi:hypothetical protein, partial [Lactobacillus helveticus]
EQGKRRKLGFLLFMLHKKMKVLQLNIRLQFFRFSGLVLKTSAYSQERHHFKSEFKFTAKVFKCLTSAT